MTDTREVQVRVTAKDQASQVIKGIGGKVKQSFKDAALATGALTAATGMLIKGFVDAAGEFEQTQIAFTTMLGSAEAAEKKLKELSDFASRTPFTLQGVEQSAKQLLAMGIESDNLIPTLKSLGDVSAGLSVDLNRIALNYGQVATQAKLTGVELKDFMRAGVPLLAELAKNLNVSEAEIRDMVSAGEIGFEQVEEAFRTMTSEGGKFADLMDKQSQSFLGQVSNMEDQIELFQRQLGTVMIPILAELVSILQKVVEWFSNLSPETQQAIAQAILLGGALLGVSTALGIIAMAVNPVTLAIGAIIAAFILLQTHAATITDAMYAFWLQVVAAFENITNWLDTNFGPALDRALATWQAFWNAMLAIVNAIVGGIRAMLDGLVNAINRAVSSAQAAAASISKSIGGVSSAANRFGSMFDLKRYIPKQRGGLVERGEAYLVGEAGAELFVPSTAGRIIPNHALQGGAGVIISGNVLLDENTAERIGDMIINRLRLNTRLA